MCLQIVDEKIKGGTGVGYKVFLTDERYHLSFEYFGGRIKYNEWYQDKARGEIFPHFSNPYPKGYHIFTALEDAKNWCYPGEAIRRVDYKNVVASGTQGGYPIVVAREMYIHKGRVE